MNVESLTKNSFTISWSKPSSASVKIDDYRIYYRTVNGKWSSKDIKTGLDNETLSAKVNGLVSGELYQVKVNANEIIYRACPVMSYIFITNILPFAKRVRKLYYVACMHAFQRLCSNARTVKLGHNCKLNPTPFFRDGTNNCPNGRGAIKYN
jgi:hypothetical protein